MSFNVKQNKHKSITSALYCTILAVVNKCTPDPIMPPCVPISCKIIDIIKVVTSLHSLIKIFHAFHGPHSTKDRLITQGKSMVSTSRRNKQFAAVGRCVID